MHQFTQSTQADQKQKAVKNQQQERQQTTRRIGATATMARFCSSKTSNELPPKP